MSISTTVKTLKLNKTLTILVKENIYGGFVSLERTNPEANPRWMILSAYMWDKLRSIAETISQQMSNRIGWHRSLGKTLSIKTEEYLGVMYFKIMKTYWTRDVQNPEQLIKHFNLTPDEWIQLKCSMDQVSAKLATIPVPVRDLQVPETLAMRSPISVELLPDKNNVEKAGVQPNYLKRKSGDGLSTSSTKKVKFEVISSDTDIIDSDDDNIEIHLDSDDDEDLVKASSSSVVRGIKRKPSFKRQKSTS